MFGSVTEFGGPTNTVYFTEEMPAANETRLIAVVVWRTGSASPPWNWRDALRRLRYRVGFGTMNAKFYLGRESGLWIGSAGAQGERETLFHPIRRVVRVQGRAYPLPPDQQTLILLVDESTHGVTRRTVVVPMGTQMSFDELADPEVRAQRSLDAMIERQKTWGANLRSDPDVRAFMTADTDGSSGGAGMASRLL